MRTIPFLDTESLIIPRIIPFAGLMLLFVITAFALSLQINRQQTIGAEIGLNQRAHAIVYHGGQLIHEQWQLHKELDGQRRFSLSTNDLTDSASSAVQPLQPATVALYASRIETHLAELEAPLDLTDSQPLEPMMETVATYRAHWSTVQTLLAQMNATPDQRALYARIEGELTIMDRLLTQIVDGGQQLFTVRLNDWLDSLQSLNRLLTSATTILLVTVLLVSYLFYLFFSMQANVERALRNSAKRLHTILDTIPDAVLRLQRDGQIVDHKPAQYYQPFINQEFIGASLQSVVPEPIATHLLATAEEVFNSGIQQTIEYALPISPEQESFGKPANREQVNNQRTFEARFLPTANDEIQLLVRDITDEKAADAATMQAQKLESIGLLAGGIAHDFNNILTGLLAQVTLATRKADKGLPVADNLKKATLSTRRAADLTRQLLAYAGQGKFQIRSLNLNQLIMDTATLLETALAGSEQLELNLAPHLPNIAADQGQMQQIVMNLVINAAEALQDEWGKVHVHTAVRTLQSASDFTDYMGEVLEPGTYVMLAVRDDGIGMDQAMLARIFDPFFSTKQSGHGLGLSAVLGIIRAHKGGLAVESRPGNGTTFTILLPVQSTEQTVVAETVESTTPHTIDMARAILVIDDEAPVREAATDILTDQGFAVMTASGGEEGLATLRRQREKIGVVLLDVRMPGMDGTETYQKMRQIEPDVKVIFTSGYSESEIALVDRESSEIAFLPKPYSAESLTQYIHKILQVGD